MDAADIEERAARVQARLAEACRQAGRAEGDVQLVAASKKQPPEAVEVLARCGIRVFGESRVQEAQAKIPLCPGQIEWHFVGHLQSNKVAPAVALFRVMHAVDSLRLLNLLDCACAAAGERVGALLAVNLAGEASKYGFAPEDVEAALLACNELQAVAVEGLMALPPFTPEAAESRPHFARLRELRDRLRVSTGFRLDALSMGMSRDFEYAVLEGATYVRVGTDLFGARGG